MQKQIWAYEESRPFADLSEREGDVDEHEDVGDGDGHDITVGLAFELVL